MEHSGPCPDVPDRYLYRKERSSVSDDGLLSVSPGPPEISDDLFKGFEAFVCPACDSKGKVILEESSQDSPPRCPLCEGEMDALSKWVT